MFPDGVVRTVHAEITYRRHRKARDAEKAARRHWKELSSRTLVIDVVREWHRHTERNWIVLRQILTEMNAGHGIPLECHIEKLRYVGQRAVFDHDRLILLDQDTRELVNELQPIIRNVNLEIDEFIRAIRTGDLDYIKDAAGLVQRKFQFLFAFKLPSIVRNDERAGWLANPDIIEARDQEIANRHGRKDIVYRRPPKAG